LLVLTIIHKPVLLKETIQALDVQPGKNYVDCTVGGGGHAAAILEKASPGGKLLGIDADPEAIRVAAIRLNQFKGSIILVNDNFANLAKICRRYSFSSIHGILIDLGLSTYQLEGTRGFSFLRDSPLDMRFNPSQTLTAADIVNKSSEIELALILREYGEEKFAAKIASHIVRERPINTTLQLARVVTEAIGGKRGRINPATRTFQALRIAVNRELEAFEDTLTQTLSVLSGGGRLAVISYHSLEDRIVKHFIQREAKDCICPPGVPVCHCNHKASLKIVNKKVIVPSPQEIRDNPRSRSARMRIAEKIASQKQYPASDLLKFSKN
jgi:16S rRNA (cytosine1402-N4)-methyltransferase